MRAKCGKYILKKNYLCNISLEMNGLCFDEKVADLEISRVVTRIRCFSGECQACNVTSFSYEWGGGKNAVKI